MAGDDDPYLPNGLYVVSTKPAVLAGMRYPGADTSWEKLREAGYTGIVCLAENNPGYDPAPLKMLYAARLEDLYGAEPSDEAEQERLVRGATQAVVDALRRGENVIVHCMGGTGRTGTVIGCTLRGLGFSTDMAIRRLKMINLERGVGGWPESRWQDDMVRKF